MSDFEDRIRNIVNDISDHLQNTWPLYSFVTSNPLAGFEDQSFSRALKNARGLFGGHGYPPAHQFRQAWNNNRIDTDLLQDKLQKCGYEQSPNELLATLKQSENGSEPDTNTDPSRRQLDQILEKWLSVYLDEGRSRWEMPNREQGFYSSWIDLAPCDHQIPEAGQLRNLPGDPIRLLERIFEEIPEQKWKEAVTYQLSALPGWVGYIKHRTNRNSDGWARTHPIDLIDYLAVRLIIARQLNAPIVPADSDLTHNEDGLDEIRRCFLEAWEETYQNHLLKKISTEKLHRRNDDSRSRPDAQFVFCIDTRSEIIRRHIESTGSYETHGYAGFFGVPVRRSSFGDSTDVDACPPIVEPEHFVEEQPGNIAEEKVDQRLWFTSLLRKSKKTLKSLKDNIAAAFSFVEMSGLFYGLGLVGRTLFPGVFSKRVKSQLPRAIREHEHVFKPDMDASGSGEDHPSLKPGLSLEDKVAYAQSAFEMMGWEQFAPIVVFAGHVSQTVNNPFDSSLRCGACAGNSGVPNAKILAFLCNEEPVREALREEGIEIPEDTVFLPARHNTTTDKITIFDEHLTRKLPNSLDDIKGDLATARRKATEERMEDMPDSTMDCSIKESDRRSSDWAQVRPEWGLAGNAAFIVGPNALRNETDLEGRVFLHSYNWKQDDDGNILEQIMAGPVIVCQWINHQYYFSTVDNGVYGSGSKITHNPVGNFGVLQGNGGDLMGGLPMQSLMASDSELQHEPLRITNVIHAPEERVLDILDRQEQLQHLLDNNWMNLVVLDPLEDHKPKVYSQTERMDPPPAESYSPKTASKVHV